MYAAQREQELVSAESSRGELGTDILVVPEPRRGAFGHAMGSSQQYWRPRRLQLLPLRSLLSILSSPLSPLRLLALRYGSGVVLSPRISTNHFFVSHTRFTPASSSRKEKKESLPVQLVVVFATIGRRQSFVSFLLPKLPITCQKSSGSNDLSFLCVQLNARPETKAKYNSGSTTLRCLIVNLVIPIH